MQSRLTVILTIACLIGIALFVWYLSSNAREQTASETVVDSKPEKEQEPLTVDAPSPEPKPSPPTTSQRRGAEPPLQPPAPDSTDTTGARVEGLVITKAGAPIKDAKVFVGPESADPRAQTDEKGRFVIDGLSTSDTFLMVTHEKYVPGTATVSPEVGKTTEVRITLDEGGTIEGIVSRGGAPAPGEIVRAFEMIAWAPTPRAPWDQTLKRIVLQATTDAQGHYVLDHLPFGEIEMEALDAESYEDRPTAQWARAIANVVTGQTTVVDFDLPSIESVIQGVVLVEGQPPGQTTIRAKIVCDYGQQSVNTHAEADGTYRLEGLPAGAVRLEMHVLSPEGTRRRSVDLTLGESQVVQSDFLFSGACAVSGTVAGVLADEHAVVLALTEFPSDASELTFQDLLIMSNKPAGVSDVSPDGTFRIDGLDPGSYTILALAMEQQQIPQGRTTHKAVQLSAGTEVRVNLNLR
jgi:hypothetical protein